MEKEAYRLHYQLYETFWWFRGRNRIIDRLLEPFLSKNGNTASGPLSILDVGCGTGGMFPFWGRWGTVWGLDLSREALTYCQRRNTSTRLVQGSTTALPFSEETFHLITACDLLYHRQVQNDQEGLQEFYRICKKGGRLLVIEPAFNCLGGGHDQFFHGARRYTIPELTHKVTQSGFVIERISYFNMFLSPFVYVWRKLKKNSVTSDLKAVPFLFNFLLTGILSAESKLMRRQNLPFGTSVICLAKKPA